MIDRIRSMWTLGIETSDRTGAAALLQDGVCVAERQLAKSGRRHAQTLVSEVDSLFRKHDLAPNDCDLVGVSVGPGSFTGLRVGTVFAKTFAYVTGCQVVAVGSLHSLAQGASSQADEIWAIADAQRGELFVGKFTRADDSFMDPIDEIEIQDAISWCQSRSNDELATGTAIDKYEHELQCRILDASLRQPRAEWVARLAERSFQFGQTDDPWTLEPRYIRTSAAEEKWDAKKSKSQN